MDIQDYDSKIYYMSLGAKLLFGELSEFNLEHYNKAEYIEYANKLLRMENDRYINKSDLGIIAQYISLWLGGNKKWK